MSVYRPEIIDDEDNIVAVGPNFPEGKFEQAEAWVSKKVAELVKKLVTTGKARYVKARFVSLNEHRGENSNPILLQENA